MQTITNMIGRHLAGKKEMWPLLVVVAAHAMNTLVSPSLSDFFHMN